MRQLSLSRSATYCRVGSDFGRMLLVLNSNSMGSRMTICSPLMRASSSSFHSGSGSGSGGGSGGTSGGSSMMVGGGGGMGSGLWWIQVRPTKPRN